VEAELACVAQGVDAEEGRRVERAQAAAEVAAVRNRTLTLIEREDDTRS
jgi:hypothetical protein